MNVGYGQMLRVFVFLFFLGFLPFVLVVCMWVIIAC
jgi:hypothetical protein